MRSFILFILLFVDLSDKNEGLFFEDLKYDTTMALELMLLNNFTYNSEVQDAFNDEAIKEALKKQMAAHQETKVYELIWLGVSKNNGNLTYVARKKENDRNVLVIVSRGTIFSLEDVLEDVEVYHLTGWQGGAPFSAKISEGIHKALKTTMSLISKNYDKGGEAEAVLTLKALLKEELKANNTALYVTGHSLGGSISAGLALHIAEDYYDMLQQSQMELVVYSFAGHTIGNEHFKQYYDSFLLDETISFSYNRVVNPFDIVPFAFHNLDGIKHIGYPYSKITLLEVEALIETISISCSLDSKRYIHVGGPPIKLKAALSPPNCSETVEDFETFGCWVVSQHHAAYYVELLRNTINKN